MLCPNVAPLPKPSGLEAEAPSYGAWTFLVETAIL